MASLAREGDGIDALSLLKEDHRRVRKLADELVLESCVEQELFPKTKTIFSEDHLAYLGAEMAAHREQAQTELIEEEVMNAGVRERGSLARPVL